MSRLRVLPIVEGDGEVQSIRILLQRIWRELLGGEFIDVLRPIKQSRQRLVMDEHLRRALDLAALKLSDPSLITERSVVLLLLDSDDDQPCILGPDLLRRARSIRPDVDVSCVLAHLEYETWFVASAESLADDLTLSAGEIPANPELSRSRKAWIEQRFNKVGARYSETVDQPRMTSRMDLNLCRSRSRSFDKLCRELESRR